VNPSFNAPAAPHTRSLPTLSAPATRDWNPRKLTSSLLVKKQIKKKQDTNASWSPPAPNWGRCFVVSYSPLTPDHGHHDVPLWIRPRPWRSSPPVICAHTEMGKRQLPPLAPISQWWVSCNGAKVIKHPHKARLSVVTAGRRRLSAWLISDVEQCSMERRTVRPHQIGDNGGCGSYLMWSNVQWRGGQSASPNRWQWWVGLLSDVEWCSMARRTAGLAKSVTMVGGKGPMHGSRSPFGRRYTV
jgi:hypothetical protein